MKKKTLFTILLITALAYYWLLPFGRLFFQFAVSSRNLTTNVSSLTNPVIVGVYILPSYESHNSFTDGLYNTTFNLKKGKNTIVIIGRNFKSLDEAHSSIVSTVTINGQEFSSKENFDPTIQDSQIRLEVDNSVISSQRTEIVVTREGKKSNTFSLTDNDVSRQLATAQDSSPAIIAAIPVGYPYNQYAAQGVDILFLITGWPNIQNGVLQRSVPCTLKVDGESYDCYMYYNFVNLNIYDWKIPLNKPSHEATITLGGIASSPYRFDTAQFEQAGIERQTSRDTYYKNLSGKELAAGRQIPLIGQSKNGSLPALGINLVLTFIVGLLFRPWRFNKTWRWILTFIIPVMLQALAGVVYASLYINNDFLGPVIRAAVILGSLSDAIIPLLEGIIVAIVVTYSIKSLRNADAVV